ncbi:MAG: hypothetical protein US53_C0071G0004 [Candidatus Woesebacteria bacterium GW2011_GWA1_37_7]|uniref:Uncharacterized protein n=1 Tax=Candidatus Woesebacteria bacterium GW2011_GWA1_37_7 TaxID=1618545 RepID=A0A0G0H0P0_9BACT|nr:MAG: hypothetical protein US53_C0071G0004 [Candidatus Woesebacteria bacterium GW2011_GWA1_37_7]
MIYETPKKSKVYLFAVAAFASLIGWAYMNFYKPQVIEASCSEIAVKSSNLFRSNNNLLEPSYTYEYLKAKCMDDSFSSR